MAMCTKEYKGHMSHVQCVRWNRDDSRLFSAGGKDCCIFQWKHVAVPVEGAHARQEHRREAEKIEKEGIELLEAGRQAMAVEADRVQKLESTEKLQLKDGGEEAHVRKEEAESERCFSPADEGGRWRGHRMG